MHVPRDGQVPRPVPRPGAVPMPEARARAMPVPVPGPRAVPMPGAMPRAVPTPGVMARAMPGAMPGTFPGVRPGFVPDFTDNYNDHDPCTDNNHEHNSDRYRGSDSNSKFETISHSEADSESPVLVDLQETEPLTFIARPEIMPGGYSDTAKGEYLGDMPVPMSIPRQEEEQERGNMETEEGWHWSGISDDGDNTDKDYDGPTLFGDLSEREEDDEQEEQTGQDGRFFNVVTGRDSRVAGGGSIANNNNTDADTAMDMATSIALISTDLDALASAIASASTALTAAGEAIAISDVAIAKAIVSVNAGEGSAAATTTTASPPDSIPTAAAVTAVSIITATPTHSPKPPTIIGVKPTTPSPFPSPSSSVSRYDPYLTRVRRGLTRCEQRYFQDRLARFRTQQAVSLREAQSRLAEVEVAFSKEIQSHASEAVAEILAHSERLTTACTEEESWFKGGCDLLWLAGVIIPWAGMEFWFRTARAATTLFWARREERLRRGKEVKRFEREVAWYLGDIQDKSERRPARLVRR